MKGGVAGGVGGRKVSRDVISHLILKRKEDSKKVLENDTILEANRQSRIVEEEHNI